jgi:DNA ligase (NAD+)
MSDLIQNLVDKLHDANRAYRDGSPYLNDAEFDILEEQLRIIDPNNDWFKRGVNDATPKKRKVKLPHPMMSLDKVKTIDNLLAWVNKFTDTKFVITPKFDGLSVGLNGNVSWTRGDGIIGQDCTKQLMHTNKPHSANITENSVIRGEIIFTNANWELFKKEHPEAVSSRNSATGLINGDFDANRISDYSLLSIMPYEIIGSDMPKDCQLNYLGTDIYETVQASQLNDEFLLNLYVKWKNLYPIDGLVIDVNNPIHRTGTEANGNPSYTIAYKSPKFSETGTGIIKEIELNVNRYGIVTPVVILEEPIFLSGAMISRVSAINMNYVTLWGLVPGEKVTIVRSGEVIPKIIGVGSTFIPFRETYNKVGDYLIDYNTNCTQRLFEMKKMNVTIPDSLKICPHCSSKLEELINEDGDWCEMYCPNEHCDGRLMESAIKFFTIAQIDGFGDKKITQIASRCLITSYPMYFDILNVDVDFLLRLDGWAETSAKAFVNECNKIKTTLPFARFLHATGWFGELGEKTLQKILDADGWDMSIEELINIEGIQTKTATTFLTGKELCNKYEWVFKPMFNFAYIKTSDVVNDGKLSGLNVCMTGFRDKMLANQISELGGNVLDSLTKNVNCLITKDKNSTSSKITKAQKMGIEVLDIQEFKTKYI